MAIRRDDKTKANTSERFIVTRGYPTSKFCTQILLKYLMSSYDEFYLLQFASQRLGIKILLEKLINFALINTDLFWLRKCWPKYNHFSNFKARRATRVTKKDFPHRWHYFNLEDEIKTVLLSKFDKIPNIGFPVKINYLKTTRQNIHEPPSQSLTCTDGQVSELICLIRDKPS